MGQTLVKVYIHLIFSTKNRLPLINNEVADSLHRYLGGICNKMDCQVIKIGGYLDHVHILCSLSKKVALVNLLEDLKSHSSKWVKTQGGGLENFYWQKGYGAFSVNPSEVETLIHYISQQHVHHAKQTFQEEYRSFLENHFIEYDERYVWD